MERIKCQNFVYFCKKVLWFMVFVEKKVKYQPCENCHIIERYNTYTLYQSVNDIIPKIMHWNIIIITFRIMMLRKTKTLNKIFYITMAFSEAATGCVLWKKVSLKIRQISQLRWEKKRGQNTREVKTQ